ncbi:MAG: hypothetical protein M1829_002679 [Trizodia sp. TS-e1964]|nr:MAG: hypothetical protein M1829_002679 [Trizodia sp. TS-e1964]
MAIKNSLRTRQTHATHGWTGTHSQLSNFRLDAILDAYQVVVLPDINAPFSTDRFVLASAGEGRAEGNNTPITKNLSNPCAKANGRSKL